MDRLAELFVHADTIDGRVPLIVGRNVDLSVFSTLPPDVEISKPSIEHRITSCKVCEADMWLGPRQRKIMKAVRLCALCCLVYKEIRHSVMGDELPFTVLNPNESQIPRRT